MKHLPNFQDRMTWVKACISAASLSPLERYALLKKHGLRVSPDAEAQFKDVPEEELRAARISGDKRVDWKY